MKTTILFAIGILAILAVPGAHALIGDNKTTFYSDGYLTSIAIEYNGTRTLELVEGSGGGGGIMINSELTINIYDNTTDYPYVELYDDNQLIDSFRMYDKEVAKIWVSNNTGNETLILITDMRGDRSAWINLVDYTCTGNETINPFIVYNGNSGFPDAIIFTWLNGCEQLVVPLYKDNYPFFNNHNQLLSGHKPFVEELI